VIRKTRLLTLTAVLVYLNSYAQSLVSEKQQAGAFPIVTESGATVLYVDSADHAAVQKTAALLQQDITAVTGKKPLLLHRTPATKNAIIIGTLDKSGLLNQLLTQKKLTVDSIRGKWEAYQLQVVEKPLPGVDRALVIAGSDRRGTAYGVLELSKQIGVSPWYWWADVPVKKKTEVYYTAGVHRDAPAVKYRGIFINDEAPALSGWSREQFGGFNHKFYEKVFELILRLKGNYLWPAMWGSAFNDDDTLNPVVADQYAIVMGTSHHEPLVRAHDEWRRYGSGKWSYDSNEVKLREFWRKGIQRMGTRENIVSIGMRGDGDEPMTEGTAIALLECIVRDQRRIIEEITGKPASETPQLWALYKEVQDYYDKGMRVPDDVTLLLCDDNWGNIRKLPKLSEKPRKGGYGIYYHFDYVGGPRNFKWINTNNIARVWEQMHLAWEYNARQIWIVNVGDIKPMEFPTSFFLDYAWNPAKWNEDNLSRYYTAWAADQFGPRSAKEIGDIIRLYSQYAARRKPELLDAHTYSIQHYSEVVRVVKEFNDLLARAEKVNLVLPAHYRDAFFQLVLHPVKALANLHELYQAVAWNLWHAAQNNPLANSFADKTKRLYENDSLITHHYHTGISNGKWNHMMSQTHIGYTYWQQPPFNKMPEVRYVPANTAFKEVVHPDNIKKDSGVKTAKHLIPASVKGRVFYEQDGYVSIEAGHFSRAINTKGVKWKIIPDIGKTGSGISVFPVTTASQQPGSNTPHTEYDVYVYDSGKVWIQAYFSPTLNFHNTEEGLRYAVSVDDEVPQIISVNKESNTAGRWNGWVANNIIIQKSEHSILKSGRHTLKFWMVDSGLVLQKLVLGFGSVQPSYLGPPETKRK
jgi:hypothetical protein